MRKGFNGLTTVIRSELGHDPLSGTVFIFFNKRRNQVKLILFEGDGLGVYHKRLEKGTYELPAATGQSQHGIVDWHDLQFILQGVDLSSIRLRKRYNRKPVAA